MSFGAQNCQRTLILPSTAPGLQHHHFLAYTLPPSRFTSPRQSKQVFLNGLVSGEIRCLILKRICPVVRMRFRRSMLE